MKSISEITGKFYEDEDCCFFRNYVQAAHYYAWGCELVDLFVDDNMKWVYVFKKEDHRKYFDRWINQNKGNEI
jgi:hypothetical protein